jgi:hypothetical protein
VLKARSAHLLLSEEFALSLPLDREWLQEMREPCCRLAIEDPLYDVRSEQGKPQHAAD